MIPGGQNKVHLEVTLNNNSTELLDPNTGKGILFSFRLLGADGQTLPFECVRTALHARVPAGNHHKQDITVIIPEQYSNEVAGIRVGLLQRGEYWVERINPNHPKIVLIKRGAKKDRAKTVLEEASQIWPQGHSNPLKWPYGTIMVSEAHKIQYMPVAKCACTSLKSMMVRLAQIEQYEKAIQLGVHLVTDRFNTGVQLKDKPIQVARDLLASNEYFKFSVVRDPFERLVSAYLEKFVHNRHNPRNLLHTRPIISDVQGTEDIDLRKGISFDDFVGYIVRQDPWDMDPHWRPQYLYFLGVPHMSRIFRLENIKALEDYLQQNLAITVKLGHENRTNKSSTLLQGASQMTSDQIETAKAIDPASFLSTRNNDDLRQRFKEDFELYESLQ